MPYITEERRDEIEFNGVLDALDSANIKVNGDLNYILFKYCKDHIVPGYNNYKNFIGELNECITEIRRRILAPYEDLKIEENGDV